MSEPFLAEIRIVAFNFAPRGWAYCDGQLLPINQNQSLYSLLGTTYGGDGRTSFALPDFRGRVPVHTEAGQEFSLGQRGGQEDHVLTVAQMAAHDHAMQATTSPGSQPAPNAAVLAAADTNLYHSASNMVDMAAEAVSNVGGGQAHENRMPFLGMRFCIALQGLFPSRS
ncbi:MAG: tail fiber protein [Myxococcales bacterium]|nr:tail fiber protein [Myxococcales bacterium]